MINTEMQGCIDNCLNCYATCEATLGYCLTRDGWDAERAQMILLLDCAGICHLSAEFLLRGSERHRETCRVCTKICNECADWCSRFFRDAVLKQCAGSCRACAASCVEMAG